AGLAAAPPAGGDLSAPAAVVTVFSEGLVGIMRQADVLGFEGRRQAFEPLLAEALDMTAFAGGAIGAKAWKALEDADRARYLAAFESYTLATYASRFDGYAGQSIEPAGERAGPQGTRLVGTRLVAPSEEPVSIDYLMREGPEGWRIIDVFVAGGLSETARHRSEFAAPLARGGIEGLIAVLDSKVDTLAAEASP
ncbi:MAG: ABC transporter substrate-binding protein, partial [Alphaproteobacteria bacterium]|nr:ABC transporter substrate-binding protein [Alphaproteobacteria bacterium]